jgi:GNAT superfamily N-acetyltransferase
MPSSVTDAPVTITPVTSARDRKRFIDFAYDFYREDYPAWIPPLRQDVGHTLDPKHNPFFEHGEIQLFLAEDPRGDVVGRIAAILNGMHLETYGDGVGFFGFFEAPDDYVVAEVLLDAASAWLRDRDLTHMRGPTNPSLNDTAGLLTQGFQREPAILMPYNPPYHEDLLVRYGFERVMTMWAYYVHKKYVKVDKLRRGARIVRHRTPGLHLRTLDMDRFDRDARTILDIYNDAWSDNWGHVPMTPSEFERLAKDLKQIVDPNIVFLLEKDGEPIAFSISLPNLNLALRHVKDGRLFPFGLPKLLAYAQFGGIYECRMPLMGVRKAYQGRALDTLLVLATIEHGPQHGYDACEMSWVLDTNNVLKNSLVDMGGVVDKQYAMFERPL